MVRDPRASLLISPREQPYVYIAVQGITTITTDGGPELDTVRVVLSMSPAKVVYSDSSSRRVSAARSPAQELASRGRTG